MVHTHGMGIKHGKTANVKRSRAFIVSINLSIFKGKRSRKGRTMPTTNTTTNFNFITYAREQLFDRKDRSAWNKGVTKYAFDILDTIEDRINYEGHEPESREELIDFMLNGAYSPYGKGNGTHLYNCWKVASEGGSYEIYDSDIAERLCTPSELKKTRNGERRPNAREDWLDVQARALYQAGNRIMKIWYEYTH